MADLLEAATEKLRSLAGSWASYTTLGSFALYVLGYLTLRFHLTALGVGTDLAVLDERYLFSGAKFLVYVVSAVPAVALLGLIVAAPLYLAHRLLPARGRAGLAALGRRVAGPPRRWLVAGLVLSVAATQLVMRQCFLVGNELVAPAPGEVPGWLARVIAAPDLASAYFVLLVAAVLAPAALLGAVRGSPQGSVHVGARRLLAFLVLVQALLLPVNYGILIMDKWLPRVTAVGAEPVPPGRRAWLVWEGKDGVTYHVRDATGAYRAMVTVPRAEAKRVEISGYDHLGALIAEAARTP